MKVNYFRLIDLPGGNYGQKMHKRKAPVTKVSFQSKDKMDYIWDHAVRSFSKIRYDYFVDDKSIIYNLLQYISG
jgi:hypothetical protein